ncbi:DUF2637 domain-containing protein [Streptomyces sp. NPDC020875]|uniref:DUF2637 domain-containing protein n=1 Tax=Streptomyces sp. NPDC020875 TaxID=3154898 RepID=UPI00340FC964
MTTHAVPAAARPIAARRDRADGDALVPIRGGLLFSAVVVVLLAVALAVIGFTGSYRSVRDLALSWGWGWFAYVFPIGIDLGIIGLFAADLFLCAIRTPVPVLRLFAWVLTAATIVFNAFSGWPTDGSAGWMDYVEAAAHATMPGLVVVITDALRRAIARRARIADGRQFEPLGFARWWLAPFATFGVWRRMRLWDVYTRSDALELERDRLTLHDELREKYGKDWKRKARAGELRAMRDAGRGLPIPAHLIANAANEVPPAANGVRANGANGGLPTANADAADRERSALVQGTAKDAKGANGGANGVRANAANGGLPTASTGAADRERSALVQGTANAADDGANARAASSANDALHGPAAANGPGADTATARTVPGPGRGRTPFTLAATPPQGDSDLREWNRERVVSPAVVSLRTVVSSTVPAAYGAKGAAGDDRERDGANAAALTANASAYEGGAAANGANGHREGSANAANVPPYAGEPAAYGANGYREGSANAAALTANASAYGGGAAAYGANAYREGPANDGGPGPSGEGYTEDRAGRRRLAEDFLRAKESEQPPRSQARFAATVGVAPATLSKAMREWREDNDG